MEREKQARANNRSKTRSKYKRSFISNAKKFGRKGDYGRGTHLEEDQYSYYINILDSMQQGFETLEDRVIMANNVLEQTAGREIYLSSNQICSKLFEALIGFTSIENFERFQTSFSADLRPICSDIFASHVLEKMMEIAFSRAVVKKDPLTSEPPNKKIKSGLLQEKYYNTTNVFSEEHRINCSQFILKIGKFLLNNLEDFVWDPCANHLMRTSILCLSGIHISKVAFNRTTAIEKANCDDKYDVPEEWIQIVREYANRLELWPQFSEFPYNEHSSALMSTLCVALKKIDKRLLKHLGKEILYKSFLKGAEDDDGKNKVQIKDDDNDAKVFQTASSVRLLETLLTVAGRKLMTQLYAMLFTGRIKVLALNHQSNFAVQKLIANIKEQVNFEAIFTEISDHIEEILKVGHSGIVTALSGACLRLATKQGAFVTAMQKALHTRDSKEKLKDFICMLKLKSYEIALEDKTQFIHLHGSLIVQDILQFNKPIFLVNCILSTPPHDLSKIFSTPNGSHVVDAFLKSKFIGEKSREKFIRHLEGYYIEMAGTSLGSRVVENLFEFSSDPQKCKIAKELSDKINQLKATTYGRILCSKLHLETYRLSQTQWKAAFNRANKVEKLFKNIVEKESSK